MTYADAIQFLYDQQMFGSLFGLDRVRRLAELAGHPHERLRFIHVAGTNGKGSVCAMLESVYRTGGWRTGLFTSPHLVHFGERMQVNRQRPSELEVVRLVERMQQLLAEGAARGWWDPLTADAGSEWEGRHSCRPDVPPADRNVTLPVSRAGNRPTFFEIVTVMALLHFVERQCELVIWETGLGGRLDATNLVTPLASVITNISLEHSQYLGDTVTKIAAEKSGIIKSGMPAVTTVDHPDALRVIREVAASRGSPCLVVDSKCDFVPAVGRVPAGYQRLNARLAVAVVEALQAQLPVTLSALEKGLAQFDWPGRLQEISQPGTFHTSHKATTVSTPGTLADCSGISTVSPHPGPLPQSWGKGSSSQHEISGPAPRRFLVDGAHNPAGMRALRETLQARPGWRPVPVIFGSFNDKDVAGVLNELAPLASAVWCVPVASPRSTNPVELAELMAELHPRLPVGACSTLAEALDRTAGEPLTLVTGSLFLVGEAIEHLSEPAGAFPAPAERPLNDWAPAPAGTAAP